MQRVHDRDHVGRTELRLDEARDLLAAGEARFAADVVVVEEKGEQPHVVAGGFILLVGIGADLARRLAAGLHQTAVELDEAEGLDLLRLAVLGDFEVALLQIGDRRAVLARGDDVDPHETDAALEGRAA